MSKIRSPQDKKRADLERDRRSAFSENDKSSRKNIPRNKQMSHQAEYRAVNSALDARSMADENSAIDAEQKARAFAIEKKRKGFRKLPDAPLKDVLEYQRTGLWPRPRFR